MTALEAVVLVKMLEADWPKSVGSPTFGPVPVERPIKDLKLMVAEPVEAAVTGVAG